MQASAAEQLQTDLDATRLAIGRSSRFARRLIDICGAGALLALSLPLILVFACLIKLQDGGPVFYRRRVVGPGGLFDAFKLRSMRVDADAVLIRDARLREKYSVNFKLKEDPRVTRLGALMRRYSIDELPQLWNVLRGQMSLVGPRMISPAELEKFGNAAWIFSHVKPGLTGHWQTRGNHEAGYAERVRMELWYVERRSLALDLAILLKTPMRVVRGPGGH